MTEEKINALRQTDTNLREALRMDEAERPQMPADLNERLMQRMASKKKKQRHVIWPWIAAACVAGVMMIWLTPPKPAKDVVAENTVTEKPIINSKVEKPETVKVETEATPPAPTPVKVKKAKVRKPVVQSEEKLLAQETIETPTIDEPTDNMAQATPKEKMRTLTEHDIPITRPENYKYTPEELALMKKQANEAYLKWVELELEIAKHNLEQTAQQ
jgi:hypothetical protein